jgi:6-phosphofructokinase 1
VRYGGIAAKIANDLEQLIDNEVRYCVLGHIQRGGDASPADRLLSARYGVKAAELIAEGQFGNVVCLRDGEMTAIPLNEVIGGAKFSKTRRVDPDCELVRVARSLGISFAD